MGLLITDPNVGGGSMSASEILTAIKTVDGSTSGLDADFLDGLHASSFATSAQGTAADAAKAKTDFLTVTQPVDLDSIETRVNALDAAVVLKGIWDASSGTFPGGGSAQAGDSYIVSVAGTVGGVAFVANDRIIAILDNASTTTYASNWHKADYTDAVLSVASLTGAISAADLRTAINVEDGADVTDTTNVTAAGALMDSEVASLSGIKTLSVPDSTTISAFGAGLVDDADAATARGTLGLGDSATKNVGTGSGDVASGNHTHAQLHDAATVSGNGISLTGQQISLDIGTGSTQVAAGNHTHSGVYQPADTQLDSLAALSYAGNTLKVVRVNSGETGFELASVSVGGGDLLAANNLSDLANAATARTNLGLGTAATTDASAYATAAQGTDERVPTAAGLTSKFGTNKASIADGDKFGMLDGAASDVPKHTLWSLIKSTLKAYFDSLYATAAQGTSADAAKTKTDFLTVTQAVDLDALETASHAAVTLAGTPDYITLSGQVLTRGQVDLAADITGTLPVANGGTGQTSLASLDAADLGSGASTDGYVLTSDGAGGSAWEAVAGSGTVTSVAVSGSDGIEVDSGSPITGSGTIALGVNASSLKSHLSLGNVENTALSTWAGSTAITTLGTIATGSIPLANVSGTGDAAAKNTGTTAGTVAAGDHVHEGTAILSTGEIGGTKFLREDGDGTCSWQAIAGGGDALTANPLSQFAATTSSQLAGVISDETGSGALVFATSPTLVTPALGTPSSGVLTNCTGLPTAGLVDDAVTLGKMASGTAGNLITYDASGNPAAVATGTSGQVLTSNGAGAAPTFQTAAGGGLTNLTETLHTSSPNNTVNAAELAVTGGTTNVDLVLAPKGTGALILGPEPDSTATGGNKRGAYAVDLQVERSTAAQAATGAYSMCQGRRNVASSDYGIALGESNTTTGIYGSATIGNSNTNGARYTLVAGSINNVGGGESAPTIGYAITNNGSYVFSGGSHHTVSSNYTATLGYYALAERSGTFYFGGGRFGAVGDNQFALPILRGTTSNATPTELFLEGSNRFTVPASGIVAGTLSIVGTKTDGSAVAHYVRQFCLKNVSGTTSAVYSAITIGTDNAAGTSVSVTANDTNDALKVEVTGIAAENWRWQAVVFVNDIKFTS